MKIIVDSDTLIRIVSDTPFIRVNRLAEKLGISYRDVRGKVEALKTCGKLFSQKRGDHAHLVTTHYAKKNHVPDVYVEEESRSILEQQMWFNDLSRVAL